MISLTREFRFCLTETDSNSASESDLDLERVGNSWNGWFTSNRITPYLKFRLTVGGAVQNPVGYLCNVKLLDEVIRKFVCSQIRDGKPAHELTYEQLLMSAVHKVIDSIPQETSFERLELVVSPTFSYAINQESLSMVTTQGVTPISLTQQFEFSAAHRLHCPEFSDEKNREIFGKCNNPKGHGHNYVLEVTVCSGLESADGQVVCLADFEATVKRLVIDRLDHKHLNLDVAEFADLNPSVENIALTIWDWLNGNIEGAKLSRIRVYETPKTWADYSG